MYYYCEEALVVLYESFLARFLERKGFENTGTTAGCVCQLLVFLSSSTHKAETGGLSISRLGVSNN